MFTDRADYDVLAQICLTSMIYAERDTAGHDPVTPGSRVPIIVQAAPRNPSP